MGKRSNFERRERDFYPTPYEAVLPLLSHLGSGVNYIEPCAGDGALVAHLTKHGHKCVLATDIEPINGAWMGDATEDGFYIPFDCFITNPPWDRKVLHPIINNLSRQAPTWLLFDADWIHTKQSAPFMDRLQKIVSVGRVKWIPDSKMTGKDNCAWYLFGSDVSSSIEFYGRAL